MVLRLFQGWVQQGLGDQDNRSDDHVTFRRDYEHERILEISACSLRIMYSRFFYVQIFVWGKRGKCVRHHWRPIAPCVDLQQGLLKPPYVQILSRSNLSHLSPC